jgi:hypothetical protein
MFAAILNSFFIVLLSMVFVQRNLIEINIYKNFEMSTKDRINLSQCSRNNKEIHLMEFVQKYTLFIFLRLLPILNQNLFRCMSYFNIFSKTLLRDKEKLSSYLPKKDLKILLKPKQVFINQILLHCVITYHCV